MSEEKEPSLTPADQHLQLANAEKEEGEPDSEVDQAETAAFIETLARIARAVASRRAQQANGSQNPEETG